MKGGDAAAPNRGSAMTTQAQRSTSLIWPTMFAGVLSAALLFAVVLATGPADATQLGDGTVVSQGN